MFKSPARKAFVHPPYLFDHPFTPRSACTPVKRAMAAERKRQEMAAERENASGPAEKLPRPTPDIPEQCEAEQLEHVSEKPNVCAPSHPTRTPRGAGRSRPSCRGRQSNHPPPYRTNIHGERQRNWYVRTLTISCVLTPKIPVQLVKCLSVSVVLGCTLASCLFLCRRLGSTPHNAR